MINTQLWDSIDNYIGGYVLPGARFISDIGYLVARHISYSAKKEGASGKFHKTQGKLLCQNSLTLLGKNFASWKLWIK